MSSSPAYSRTVSQNQPLLYIPDMREMNPNLTVPALFFAVLVSLVWAGPAAAQAIPAPESVLGHKPGDDFYLANYDESRAYFHKLAASSNRIRMISVGKTTRGLDWEIALISSPQNLDHLDKYKDISKRLALARGLNDETARALSREGKAI